MYWYEINDRCSIYLSDHVTIIVVAQSSTELLVVHTGLILAHAPQSGHRLRLYQLELSLCPQPLDTVTVVLCPNNPLFSVLLGHN